MKIVRIEREMKHKLFLGGFETIEPQVRLVAEVPEGADLEAVMGELGVVTQELWTQQVVEDLRFAHRMRGTHLPEDDKLQGLMRNAKKLLAED